MKSRASVLLTLLALVALLATSTGCPRTSSPPPATSATPTPVDTETTPDLDLMDCPGDDELRDMVGNATSLSAGDVRVLGCAAGRFPAAGWAIEAETGAEHELASHTLVVDAASRRAIAVDTAPWSGAVTREELGGQEEVELLESVDVDGDGVDEIVVLWRSTSESSGTQTLVVHRVSGDGFTRLLSERVGWLNATESWSCTASVSVAAPEAGGLPTIDVSVEAATDGMEGGADSCREVSYGIVDGSLRELPAAD